MTRRERRFLLPLLCLLSSALVGCGASDSEAAGSPAPGQEEGTETHEVTPPEILGGLLDPFTGDWDALVEARVIRVLVVASKTNYYIDGGRARGITADVLLEWEKQLNADLELGSRPMRVAAIPVTRDHLIPYLAQGKADIAAANLTMTPERATEVDFSIPTAQNISEIVVTHAHGPTLSQLSDLSGREIHIRKSSSYFESLQNLNEVFKDKGLAPVEIELVPEYLETEDLLEMVNAELIPITIADDYLANLWGQVYSNLVKHEDLAVASGRNLAWALRKDAPGLKQRVDGYVKKSKQGTMLGNMMINRYFKSAEYLKSATEEKAQERFLSMVDLFQKYGQEFEFEALLLAAQGYQESGLDQNVRSRVGAIGVMQVMPSTAADKSVNVPNIEILENNIHAGSKYLRHLIDTYFNDPGIDPLNQMLFSFAGYNAGPNRINKLRAEAKAAGYDPNVWFDNVEVIVAQKVGREPVTYVSNIAKYYIAYKLIVEKEMAQKQ